MESQQAQTRFNSALPLILKLRDLIFGSRKPDLYTRITTYLTLVIWFIFFVWHIISFTAISLREVIYTEKQINVEELIFQRGEALGFQPYQFLNLLMEYHLISSVCWGVMFLGIVFMWRRKKIFALFIFGSGITYFTIILLYMHWNYFMQDTTWFDKITLAVFAVNSLLYFFFMPKAKHVNDILPAEEE